MQLDYFSGDYQKQGSPLVNVNSNQPEDEQLYNGLIRSQSWHTFTEGRVNQTGAYAYEYDDRYQLQEATYGQVSNGRFTPAGNQAYAVQNLSYDLNGNLLGLQRRDQDGHLLHDFDGKYYYEGNTNQLSSVTGYASYTYNAIGQMTYEKKGEQVQQLGYDVSGKVQEIKDGSGEAKFIYTYDDRGYRVKKEDKQTQQATYYLRDASGMLLSIYEQDLKVAGSMPEATEVPIYGASRLDFFRPDPIDLSEYLACFDDSQTRSAYENKSYIMVEGAEMTLSEGFEVSYQDLEILLTPTSPEMGSDGDSNNIHLVLRNT